MSRSASFGSQYINSNLLGGEAAPGSSIALLVLARNNVQSSNIGGSSLPGYDIKSQDGVTMLRLSLVAGESLLDGLPEVYCNNYGIATKVMAGKQEYQGDLTNCFLQTSTSNFINKVDHVLVKASDPLPTRYSKPPIAVMRGGSPAYMSFTCHIGAPNKAEAFGHDAWAEFSTSPQSRVIQDELKAAVSRHNWEELVGYKVQFADIPKHAHISLSQTAPRTMSIPFGNAFTSTVTINLGSADDDAGGIVDISGLNATGAAVLDIARAGDLASTYPEIKDQIGYDPDGYYILLDHICGLMSISRGQNWFLLYGGDEQTAVLLLRRSGYSKAAFDVFYGFGASLRNEYYRRQIESISSISDMMAYNKQTTGEALPALGGCATHNGPRGQIIVGLGNDKGIELESVELAYSISKSTIQVKSHKRDAPAIAAALAANGVQYTPIVVQDKPAGTGWNGTVVIPPAPPDEEGTAYEVDSPIDELEGTVIDMSAPWLGNEGAGRLSGSLRSIINGDSGSYKSYSYQSGGYDLLPGMVFRGGTVHTVEIEYSDKQSVSTNITTGPKYYPVGSWSDSKYVKRSESFTKTAQVVAGSNSEGVFIVNVDGLGRYEAINTLIEPIYPGDRVEVRLLNVPVELN